MLSLVDFVLTSVNSEFTGVSMEIATRGLSGVILILGSGHDIHIDNKSFIWIEPKRIK